jgi:hypothetical protein
MSGESTIASLSGGWRLLREDPVGVLLPAAAVLGSQALALAAVQRLWGTLDPAWLILAGVGIGLLRVVVAAPFRALALAAGARQLARPFGAWRRAPSLAVVWAVAAAVEGLVVGVLLASTLAPAWWLLARGTWWGAALLVTGTAPLILILGVLARAAFAFAAVEATAGGRGPLDALGEGFSAVTRDGAAVVAILLSGELLVALGSLLCGAGALPGTPWADLALLHRWAHREETP